MSTVNPTTRAVRVILAVVTAILVLVSLSSSDASGAAWFWERAVAFFILLCCLNLVKERKGAAVQLNALFLAGLGAMVLMELFQGEVGGFELLWILIRGGFLLAVAAGLVRRRAWAWMLTCIGLMVLAIYFFTLIFVVWSEEGNVVGTILGVLVPSILATLLGRLEIEKEYRPDHYATDH